MRKHICILTVLMLLLAVLPSAAQTRNVKLTITVTTGTGDDLTGQPITLTHTDYSLSYGTLTLDASGSCSVKVYAGNHRLTIDRDGYELLTKDFTIEEGTTETNVTAELHEKVLTPFSLEASTHHNAYTGANSISLSWNTEAPAFYDDFESYDAFAINFGEWTGIDGDMEAAAPLVGSYPNRGVLQYAQIINPLAVDPIWWYDYPILRPYSGQQYVGFTRTSSGLANNDWLISPTITVGNENFLAFMGKAADQFPEKFMVYITTQVDNPTTADFVRLDAGNYETADMTGWKEYFYDLKSYAGQQIKFAIRYISEYNHGGSFMLMIDDVYVGQAQTMSRVKARRAPKYSPANPNEKFHIFLNGEKVGETEGYSYVINDVQAGQYTVGVKAVYLSAESDMATVDVKIEQIDYAKVTFNVKADSKLDAEGEVINLINTDTGESYTLTVEDEMAEILSLPPGEYTINIEEGAFNKYQKTINVTGDMTVDILLTDRIILPYNITASVTQGENGQGEAIIKWNQELNFYDSFEDYADFSVGSFGGWRTLDLDMMPVYPIGLGSASNIVWFPGAGTPTSPAPIAPMVFNPWNTQPAMMPTDNAIAAPTGDKTIIFFSPQQAKADKWLISPEIEVREDYSCQVTMKSYDSMYLESADFCVSTEGEDPSSFTTISAADRIPSTEWTRYEADLSAYANKKVRIGIHYRSYDTFLLQLDDFTVGPKDGSTTFVDFGNVIRFEIYIDGVKIGESVVPSYKITNLSDGPHTVGIKAIYQNGESDIAYYTFNVTTSISNIVESPAGMVETYNLSGQKVNRKSQLPSGIYIVKSGNKIQKIRR